MTIEQVAEGTYRLREGLVNCYLLKDGGDITVVDAAWPRSWPHLKQAVRDLGPMCSVAGILLTHGHPDHLGSAERGRRYWDVPVLAHRDEIGRVTGKAKGSSPFTLVPGLLPLLWRPKAFGFVVHAAAHGFMTPHWVAEVTGFEDGVELDLPGHPRVVLTPGHTEGHCSFYLSVKGVLIAGDALATLDPLTRASGPCLLPDPLNVDSARARASLERLDGIEADILLPGHGEPHSGPLAGAIQSALSPKTRSRDDR